MTLDLPHIFGRYTLTRLIGEGGMAEVYRASVRVAEGLTKWVVIKKIRHDFADQPEFMRMFVDEAKIALSLNHANIVQVFDFGQIGGTFYLAMELVEGLDLMRLFHAVRGQEDAFPGVVAAYIGHQVASGLAYAHRKSDDYGEPLGIVHRDVSPHNVIVSFEGQVKLLDFGIARTRRACDHDSPSDTGSNSVASPIEDEIERHTETIKGKVAYMSPEQASGRKVDQRSDIYSLGIVLYELLTGVLLFRNQDRIAALKQVRSQPIPPLLERAPEIADELARIVDRALARAPDARYQTVRELQSDLATFLHRSEPVIDDEVLQTFLDRYRARESKIMFEGTSLSQISTRDLGDGRSQGMPLGPTRRSLRVILLHAALDPRPALPTDPPSDTTRFLTVIKDIAFKREAFIVHIDESMALLAFGTVLATDDPERALRVANALREAIGESAPGVGLGIALVGTQLAVLRDASGKTSVDLPLGLGNHLESVAQRCIDDEVMVAGPLLESMTRRWRFGPLGYTRPDIAPKHNGSPWAADFQQIAPLLGPLSESERRWVRFNRRLLFGRELEMKALRDQFSAAIRGPEARSVLLVGAPGIGKRALLDRFTAALPAGSYALFHGYARWSKRNQPLEVFLGMLRRFLQISPDTTSSEIQRQLEDYGVDEAQSLSLALASALGLVNHNDIPIEPAERRHRLTQLIRRLVRGLAQRRPVLVVVENLHFLDEQSFRVIEDWTAQDLPLPILILSTSRRGARADAMASREGSSIVVIELEELDQQSRRELIIGRFENPKDAESLADAIVEQTGGNPLFIEEIIASLLQRGVLAWNPQGKRLLVRERGPRIDLPPSIESALQTRIDGLSPSSRETLQAGAVLGSRFRASEVEKILDRPSDSVLDRLVDLDLLERDPTQGPDGEEKRRFSTISLHEVCKGSIPPDLNQRMHGRAAEIKLARRDYTQGRDDGPISDHLVRAGRQQEAIDPAIRAAENAEELAGNVDTYYYLTQALKAMPDRDPRHFSLLARREPILRAWGRRRAQGADIRRLLQEAEWSEDSYLRAHRQILASLRLLRFYLECGRPHRAAQLLPRLRDRIEELASSNEYAITLAELESELMLAQGHLERAEALARRAIDTWTRLAGAPRVKCGLLANLGQILLHTGRLQDARRIFNEMLSLARGLGQRRIEAQALNALGEVEGRATRYQQAVDCFKQALAIDRDLGDRFATGTKLANLGLTYTALGLYRRAELYLRKALDLHEAIGHPALLNDVMVKLGHVVAELGDPHGAQELLKDAARVALERGDLRTELRAKNLLVAVLLDEAATDQASVSESLRSIEQGRELTLTTLTRAKAAGLRTAQVRSLHNLARIATARAEFGAAINYAQAAVRLVRAGAAPLDGVHSLHLLGSLLKRVDRPKEATSLLREAATSVQARLDDLRDGELRRGYQSLPVVSRILEDGAPPPVSRK